MFYNLYIRIHQVLQQEVFLFEGKSYLEYYITDLYSSLPPCKA